VASLFIVFIAGIRTKKRALFIMFLVPSGTVLRSAEGDWQPLECKEFLQFPKANMLLSYFFFTISNMLIICKIIKFKKCLHLHLLNRYLHVEMKG